MSRYSYQLYPDLSAFLKEIKENGISTEILEKIIERHRKNYQYNKDLYERYMTLKESVPIYSRTPRFEEDSPINNKINNDFFSEIVDFKTGYFAGRPITYGYNKGEESEEETGNTGCWNGKIRYANLP